MRSSLLLYYCSNSDSTRLRWFNLDDVNGPLFVKSEPVLIMIGVDYKYFV